MKKFLFFFSMLFFFSLSKVSALDNFILDFRSTSTEAIFPNSINYLNNTTCTGSSYCTGNYVDTLEKVIDSLELKGYSIYIKLNRQDDLLGGSYNFNVYVFDLTKTDVSKFVLSSTIDSTRPRLSFDLKLEDDSPIYYWSFFSNSNFPFNNFDNFLEVINTTEPMSTNDFDFFDIRDYDSANYYMSSGYPYYLSDSVKITYDFNNTFDIYTDFVTNINKPLTINNTAGFGTNYLFYLRTYTSENNFNADNDDHTIIDSVNDLVGIGSDTLEAITSSDISGAEGAFNDFFGNFETDDHGLFAIISTPLNFIKSFLNSVCTPLVLPLPFVDQEVTLPCMEYVYTKFFGNFFVAYQTITTGIVAYWVCVNVMRIVKDIKDSDKDTIEVLDL